MITTPGEVRAVRKELEKTARRLTRRGVAIPDPLPPVGVMIDVPCAALAADSLAQAADFFAIGTHDLTMQTLPIYRGAVRVSYLSNPPPPAERLPIQFHFTPPRHPRIPIPFCAYISGGLLSTSLFVP